MIRSIRLALLAPLLLLASACGPSAGTPLNAPVPAGQLDDLPWESAYDADERDRTFAGVTVEIVDYSKLPLETKPLGGVRVELLVPRPDEAGPLVPVAETVSDAEGRFRIGKAPPTGFVLRARKEGFAPTSVGRGAIVKGVAGIEPGAEPPLPLARSVVAKGFVTDRKGNPVTGALVQGLSLSWFAETRTGADGGFAFDAPLTGANVRLYDPGWDVVTTMLLATGETAPPEVRIQTAPVEPFRGFVVTEEDDRPVEGAIVVSREDLSRRTTTGPDGKFVLPVPRDGRFGVLAQGRAWTANFVPHTSEAEVRLPPSKGVEGTVVDASGKPVPDARIACVSTGLPWILERVPGPRTDAEGRFRFSWVSSATRGSELATGLLAWHRKLGVSQLVRMPANGPVALKLGGVRTVEGSLVDAGGRGVPDVWVTVSWDLPGAIDQERAILPMWLSRTDTTDAEGRFHFRHVPAGVPVTVSADRLGLVLTEKIAADEPPGGIRSVRFALPAGKDVRGKIVTAAGGAPGAKGEVTLTLLDAPGITLRRVVPSAEDGSFVAKDLPPGRYHVKGHVEGFDLDAGGEALPGGPDVSIEVGRSAEITVRLVFESDAEKAEALKVPLVVRAELVSDPGFLRKRWNLENAPEKDTTFPLGRVAPDTWVLLLEGDIWRGREEVTLADGESRTVDLNVRRTLRLLATLVGADGGPVKGEAIYLTPVAPLVGRLVRAQSGEGGAVDVAGLLPGKWLARVTPRNTAPLEQTIEFPAERRVELRLPPSGDALVTVHDAEDQPMPDAVVHLQDANGVEAYAWSDAPNRVARFRTDAEGRALLRGLPAGKARVVVTGAGLGKRPPVDFVVPAGGRVEVTAR